MSLSTGDGATAKTRVHERHVRPLFLLTIITGSFLLFLTQPMIARMALPRVGGAPAVWNSAMLIYQLLLLGGYVYAHWLSRLRPRRQAAIHLILFALAALWLPIGLTSATPPTGAQPAFWVPWFLMSSIGPLFFIISAQAPLMQRWYGLETKRGDPYPLYAASNLGSFAGLISYPLLVEPIMTLQQQSWLWTGLFGLLVMLVAVCALTVPAVPVEPQSETTDRPGFGDWLRWVLLAAVPSGLMLSTTTHLTTDIVAMPLLWALPLGLYLLSFVIAFAGRRGPADLITVLAPLVILVAGGLAFSTGTQNPFFSATLGLFLLFVVSVALHTRLFRARPEVDQLTRFYVAMSVGGMLGGLFCAVVAPLLFDWAYEHPLLVLAAALVVPQYSLLNWPKRWARMLGFVIPVLALILSFAFEQGLLGRSSSVTLAGSIIVSLLALTCLGRRWPFMVSLAALMLSYGGWSNLERSFAGNRTRSYFGIYEVTQRRDGSARLLTHGTTLHGIQNMKPGLETVATSYYARRSGVGHALANAPVLFGPAAPIGIVGLGTGTLSCYAAPDQRWTFFEIDPAMVQVARNRFTFLSRCAPQARIVLGDARLSLSRQPAGAFDLLAVDAFSSDSVPMHLLTAEALQVYAHAISPNGLVLFHVSNRYLDLKPVIAELAARQGWASSLLSHDPTAQEDAQNATYSVWIALSRNPATIDRLVQLSGEDSINWVMLERKPGFEGWTDDYASILPILSFGNLLPRALR